ncbi:methyl-accepting chemotaxis protein [Rhodopseudomonas sp. BAL398]|nr:methyl-accepting chemotaxis protein [Rhodopseudomonas sp. BAL398]WOK20747.1 methyl-accepting chemotaxis protein [Rhodopseudomonas sp. BAL398]
MSFLGKFRILTKIISVIVLIGIMVLGGAWYATSQMDQIDQGYSKFLNKDARSWIAVPRLSRNLSEIRYLSYRMVAETDPEPIRQAEEELGKAFEESVKQTNSIKELTPAFAERVDAIAVEVAKLRPVLQPIIKAAKANQNDLALAQLRSQAQPIFDTAVAETRALRVSIDNAIHKGSEDLTDSTNNTIRTTWIVMSTILAIGAALGFCIAQFGIAAPLRSLVGLLQQMAKGEAVDMVGIARKDEIGETARAVDQIKVMLADKARQEAEAKIGQDQKQAAQRKQEMIKLADSFEDAVGEIIDTVSSASTELEASASTLTATAERAQEVTTMVAAASEEASTNVQSVASATEEMASSVNEISRQVQESARIANEAVDQARKTNDRVGELSAAAARIGDVVELINTIAGQTNLLALNATIEAARAGEAGRGFAVVASEVKALAEQTAKATGEISQQISGIQSATQESVGAIREIGTTIGKMSEIASTIASAVEEQGAATQEISRNVQQAAQGTQQVSSNITDVQRGATETGSASSQVLSAAQSLSRDSNRLKDQVAKFLGTVRAA